MMDEQNIEWENETRLSSGTSLTRGLTTRLRDFAVGIGVGFGIILGMVYLKETLLDSTSLPQPSSIIGSSNTSSSVHRQLSAPGRDFLEIGLRQGTDKVTGVHLWEACQKDNTQCHFPEATKPRCKVMHMYHLLYNKWLQPYSLDDTPAFQMLEIGFHKGNGFDTYQEYMPQAEMHSIEISCMDPSGGVAADNKRYQEYRDNNKLHCGNAADYNFLLDTWSNKMKRPDAPPLKIVVDDASHMAEHMAISLFFWFPKIEPGVVEDIQPIPEANKFRTHVLPQVMKDLHFCGDKSPNGMPDKACFPTIWPLLQSIHCELHICIFERNEEPAVELGQELSTPPLHALNAEECLLRSGPP